MSTVVVGIDAGGTRTRCVALDGEGRELGRADAGGANVNSSADVAPSLGTALRGALGGRTRVDALVLGMAGAGSAGHAAATRAAEHAVAGLDVARLMVCGDVEVAFAAGSAQPDGSVLAAGTGAVAARMVGFGVAARADGHGYLLGDRGSAVWIGLAALRAVLADLEGGRATALTPAVLERIGAAPQAAAGSRSRAQLVIGAAYAHPPAWLGGIAPLVESRAGQGDPVSEEILDAAVRALLDTVRPLLADPLVVTGAVAAGDGTVGTRVRARLAAEDGVVARVVTDARLGAAALALRALPVPAVRAAETLIERSVQSVGPAAGA